MARGCIFLMEASLKWHRRLATAVMIFGVQLQIMHVVISEPGGKRDFMSTAAWDWARLRGGNQRFYLL